MNAAPPLSILTLSPKQAEVVWGGHLLSEQLGKPASAERIGESWEIWEGDAVEAGPFRNQRLATLADRFPRELMGEVPVRRGLKRFPLLTKFIDAQECLSVQVHPDDRGAQRLENQPNGKTEAWYILGARPDAWIIHGLTRRVEAAEFRAKLEAGNADDLLRKVPAIPGQTFFVPAGTVHAIGPGVLLHEVQQTSDVTYRLYDWNRQQHGSKRELHLDKGVEVSWLAPSPNPTVEPLVWRTEDATVALILASEYFTVKRIGFPGRLDLDTAGASFHIVTVLEGGCAITSSQSGDTALGKGRSALIPASFGPYALQSESTGEALVEYVGDPRATRQELDAAGFAGDRVDEFLGQFKPLSS